MATSRLALLISTLVSTSLACPTPVENPPVLKSCGCGIQYPDLTQPQQSVTSSGQNRSYYVHLPEKYNSDEAYTMVVGFHGSDSIGLYLPLDTKLNESRFSGNKIMVYPNGIGGSWAGPSYHNGSTVQEDIQFVQDVINDVQGKYCVDAQRVFGLGFSNGGGFIDTLACDEKGSSLFTGFASHSGSFYTDINGPDNGCKPSKVTPMLEIHGGADKVVPYNGGQGEGGQLPSIPDWLSWWVLRNKCTNETEQTLFDGEVRHLSWSCAGISNWLQHYEVKNLGHAWADTEPNFSQAVASQGPTVIQASRIIMDFFDSVKPWYFYK